MYLSVASDWPGMHCSFDTLGIAGDDGEVGFGRLVGLRTALFPIPQSAQRDVVAQGKLLLRQRETAAEGLNTWRRAQLPRPHLGERRVFRIMDGGGLDFLSTPRSQGRSLQRFLGAIRFDPDQSAVTVHSDDSRGLAHFLSPSEQR